MKIQVIIITLFSLKLTEARFTNLGIEEFYLPHCESEIVFSTDHHAKCQLRTLEVQLDTEENKTYIKCMLESFLYWTGREKFDGQALLKDYHLAGIKNRDKVVLESYQNCMKNYGYSSNPMKVLDCLTKDKDFPKVINAKHKRNPEWKPSWMKAVCGPRKLFR